VIDARIAFLGGMNLIDDFEPVRFDAPRFDFTSKCRGRCWPPSIKAFCTCGGWWP